MPYYLKNFDWYALKLNLKPALTLEYSAADFAAFSRHIRAIEKEGFIVHSRDIASRPLALQKANRKSLSNERSKYQIFISKRMDVIDSLVAAYDGPDLKKIGLLLGYPKCCVDFYFSRANYVDKSRPPYLAVENNLLARGALPEAQCFVPGVNFLLHYDGRVVNSKIMKDPDFKKIFDELFSYSMTDHFPCSLSCGISAARGRLICEVVRKAEPEWALRAEELAGNPVLYLDNFRFFILKSPDRCFERISYSSVVFSSEAGPGSALAEALKRGDAVDVAAGKVSVFSGGRAIFQTRSLRCSPKILPFHSWPARGQ